MTTVRQIQAHQPVVRLHDCLIDLEICWATAQRLHIDSPLFRIELEGFQSPLLAQQLYRVDVLISAVVPSSRISFRVLVRHGRAKSVEDCSRRDIFGGNEEDGLSLTLDFFFLLECSAIANPNKRVTAIHTIISDTSGSVSINGFSISYTDISNFLVLGCSDGALRLGETLKGRRNPL